MKSSHCPKYERKILKIFCPKYSGQNFSIFLFIFWAMQRLYIFILKLPDLQLKIAGGHMLMATSKKILTHCDQALRTDFRAGQKRNIRMGFSSRFQGTLSNSCQLFSTFILALGSRIFLYMGSNQSLFTHCIFMLISKIRQTTFSLCVNNGFLNF